MGFNMGIDPGGTTGLAISVIAEDSTPVYATITIPNYDIDKLVGMIVERATRLEVVVIESFLGIQYRSSHGIETIELIGAVRGICSALKIPVVKQAPAMRKPFERPAKLILEQRKKNTGLSYMDHEVSALSHLLLWEHKVARKEAQHGNNAASGVPT